MQNNLLEIGKIVRAHGIKGAVKILSYLDSVDFSIFKKVLVGQNAIPANFTNVQPLNNDAFSVKIDIISNIDATKDYINQSVYVVRNDYKELNDIVYLEDFIGKKVISKEGNDIGIVLSADNYGATDLVEIKCGPVTYTVPFIDEIVIYDEHQDVLVIDEQKFIDLRV